ncbi:hypothetical protein EIN_150520 [Entamoeba invadens IP1]|uniref:Leucine rich repeat containing protein BspA family protein n=1 Tax=Entamoeba invadens IP1 TaxID=370355 RepID=A0A0A1U8B5_ENTIV|nr:hypothetical protein EIN_150520 [Entamoeba invadens IP1]ELP91185.1 hypothetical protein EIN_150520 [Entamoeba invadens IP1]|eukprot:XP_004257956.1 hypothetical protein EIN_150520 [Entamoeba invadens IP1]
MYNTGHHDRILKTCLFFNFAYQIKHIMIKLDRYSMMIVSKYFYSVGDFIKLIKVCKKFEDIPAMFHYNPIPLNRKEKLFSNVETLVIHAKNEHIIPGYFKYVIKYEIDYQKYLKSKTEHPNYIYEKVCYNQNDRHDNTSFVGATIFGRYTFAENKFSFPSLFDATGVKIFKFVEIKLDKNLVELPDYCFDKCSKLKSIDLSNVLIIGDSCFFECKSLTSITFSGYLKTISENALIGVTSLQSVVFTDFDFITKSQCFKNCLINITVSKHFGDLPHKVIITKEDVFNGYTLCLDDEKYEPSIESCPIEVLNFDAFKDKNGMNTFCLPTTVTEIRSGCFSNCDLKQLDLSHVNVFEYSIMNELTALTFHTKLDPNFLCKMPNLKNVKLIGGTQVEKSPCFLHDVFESCGYSVETYSFYNEDVILYGGMVPTFCKQIEYEAMCYIGVSEICIPTSVTFISWNFTYCDNLKKITILGNNVILPEPIASYCDQLEEAIIYTNCGGVRNFRRCDKLRKITFRTLPTIKENEKQTQNEIEECSSLKEIVIENSPKDGIIHESVTYFIYNFFKNEFKFVGDVVFVKSETIWNEQEDDQSVEYEIPEGVTVIGSHALDYKDYVRVIIPKSVRLIQKNAFYKCEKLETIEGITKDVKLEEGWLSK